MPDDSGGGVRRMTMLAEYRAFLEAKVRFHHAAGFDVSATAINPICKPHQWGLLDTEDRLWLGDDAGPSLYESEALAQAAAILTAIQLEWPPWRVKAHPFTLDTPLRQRDEVLCTDAGIERARALVREDEA